MFFWRFVEDVFVNVVAFFNLRLLQILGFCNFLSTKIFQFSTSFTIIHSFFYLTNQICYLSRWSLKNLFFFTTGCSISLVIATPWSFEYFWGSAICCFFTSLALHRSSEKTLLRNFQRLQSKVYWPNFRCLEKWWAVRLSVLNKFSADKLFPVVFNCLFSLFWQLMYGRVSASSANFAKITPLLFHNSDSKLLTRSATIASS